jgi:3-hydroxyacyl-[acyl-carrier-protein] dehydratase
MNLPRTPTQIDCQFPANHPAFAGHFPGQPIVPGVLLLDALIQSLQSAWHCQVNQVVSCKFLSPAGPDERLTLHYAATPGVRVVFRIEACARQIASGVLLLAEDPA